MQHCLCQRRHLNARLALVLCSAASAWLAGASQVAGPVSFTSRDTVSQQLGVLLATSQQSLEQAEAFYEKAAQKAKQDLSQLLTTEAKHLVAGISDLAGSISNASVQLAQVANATRAGIAQKSTAKGSSGGAVFSVVEEQASLVAEVDSADAYARRLARQHASAQRRATAQAVEQLENLDPQLSRKLGDVSAMLEGAKAIVEPSEVEGESDAGSAPEVTQAVAMVHKPTSLQELEKTLVSAKKTAASEAAAAEKRFAAALERSTTNLSAGSSKIKAALAEAEKEEIQRVHARRVDKAPAHLRRHTRRHARHH